MENEFDFYLEYKYDKKSKSTFIQDSSITIINKD